MFDFNGTLLIVLVSFIVYLIIMKLLFFNRLMVVLNERDTLINTAEGKANNVADKFKQLELQTLQRLSEAHSKAQATVKEATNDARFKAIEIRDRAEHKAKDHILQVIAALHHSTQECYEELAPKRNEWAQTILSRLQKSAKSKEACRLS